MNHPVRKSTQFEFDTIKSVTTGQPVYSGFAAVIGTQDEVEVIVITKTKGLLRQVSKIFAPGLELDPNAIYPMTVIHRGNVQLLSDDEEL